MSESRMTPETQEKLDVVAAEVKRWGAKFGPDGWMRNRDQVAEKLRRAGDYSDEYIEAFLQRMEAPHRLRWAEEALLSFGLSGDHFEAVREFLRVAHWQAATMWHLDHAALRLEIDRLEEERSGLLSALLALNNVEIVDPGGHMERLNAVR